MVSGTRPGRKAREVGEACWGRWQLPRALKEHKIRTSGDGGVWAFLKEWQEQWQWHVIWERGFNIFVSPSVMREGGGVRACVYYEL